MENFSSTPPTSILRHSDSPLSNPPHHHHHKHHVKICAPPEGTKTCLRMPSPPPPPAEQRVTAAAIHSDLGKDEVELLRAGVKNKHGGRTV